MGFQLAELLPPVKLNEVMCNRKPDPYQDYKVKLILNELCLSCHEFEGTGGAW